MPFVFDLRAALASLDVAQERDRPALDWLKASWDEPAAFWTALLAHVQRASGPLKSVPGVVYDLYSDAVLRHATSDRIAYLRYDPLAGWTALSYADIEERARNLAGSWAALGAKPGAAIALVLDPGPDALIAMAAALRIGACLSWIPPLGDLALAARIASAKPAHIVFDPRRPPAGLGDNRKHALPLRSGWRAAPLPPQGYAEGAPFANLFSWTREPPDKPVPVSAATAYLDALRDGVFAFRIGPGDRLAAPGVHPGQHFPALWLTTMLAGATFVDLPMAEVMRSPSLLDSQSIHSLGVTSALAEALRAKPITRPPALRGIWRPVDEPLDWPLWRDFTVKNGLDQVPFGNVLVDAAAGGCLLFSARRPGSPNAKVLPSAGVPWKLFQPGSGKEVMGDSGVFVPLLSTKRKPNPSEEGWFLIARVGSEYLYGSTLLPRRAGRAFPSGELAAAISTLSFVQGASVVPLPGAGPAGGSLFVLCVFLGARSLDPTINGQIRALINERLGPDFTPDAVELFPLYARMAEKKVDADWCAGHYIGGRLHRKAADPAFQSLTRLRASLLPPPAVE